MKEEDEGDTWHLCLTWATLLMVTTITVRTHWRSFARSQPVTLDPSPSAYFILQQVANPREQQDFRTAVQGSRLAYLNGSWKSVFMQCPVHNTVKHYVMFHTRNKPYAKSVVWKNITKQPSHLDLEHLNKLLKSFINKKAFKEMFASSTLAEENKTTT